VSDASPGAQVDPVEDEDDGGSNLMWGLGMLVVGAGFGTYLQLRWDELVDGVYTRRRGGLEKLLDNLGPTVSVAILYAIGAIGAIILVRELLLARAGRRSTADDS